MMVLVQEDDFAFVLATFHWCWSPTFTLMIVPNSTFLSLFFASSITFSPHLRLLLRTFSGMYAYLDVVDVQQCRKVDFPCCCFVCRFVTYFHSLSAAFAISASSASLLVKKIVCFSSVCSFSSATNPASAIEYWSRARSSWKMVYHTLVKNHHVIHQSCWDNYLTWMSSDRTYIAQFSIFIFTDFKPCFEASTVEAMQPILIREFSFQLI